MDLPEIHLIEYKPPKCDYCDNPSVMSVRDDDGNTLMLVCAECLSKSIRANLVDGEQ